MKTLRRSRLESVNQGSDLGHVTLEMTVRHSRENVEAVGYRTHVQRMGQNYGWKFGNCPLKG